MGAAISRTVTTVRHEYAIRLPTNAVELDKAVSWAAEEYRTHHGVERLPYDDTIQISADDEEIVVWWQEAP